ncbi:molybdopterin-synthase adenylyltransferase MoeB [Hyunsoonleella pacifica]|uniref:Molybdopterin-synthase adenylyltransferase n=1 Tax=Hyunsoonleella pacifica TaxID=1080224 RepID=A0A4Q9FN31_9FLAO|nr:molybdopterin-synthase adenylyltransferase MoeB [Hyunsoonleella pacifica]TBN15758.1 molybdopterin-synthase adenylyltransferase MoeB [Hyunsoonleella pacifica]GGD22360.1 molybdenum cofactor biosynthesis protein MoeB [Hyunsoonleella pacifica]
MLSQNEKKFYSRHLLLNEIGVEGQEKLKQAKVLVVGAGGLGCPILQYLTAAGVGTIGIVDGDTVDVSNLQRQILYTVDDVGKPKAKCAASRLKQLNPYVKFNVHQEFLSTTNALALFENYDIIVDGSDNFQTRYLCNDAAVLTNKPLVFGSIFKFEGQVTVFNYNNGPTYRCLYPTPPSHGSVPSCSEIGVLGVLPGIVGNFQANETLKIILGLGEILSGKLLTFNALTMQQMQFKFSKNESLNITSLESNYDVFCGVPQIEKEITLEDLGANKDIYNLLDVRETWEREQHHIGGQHIPLGELTSRFKEIDISKPLVVYCKSGIRSARAISFLEDNLENVSFVNLKGGIG